MTSLPVPSLLELPPLALPGPLPVPPPAAGAVQFDHLLADATKRQAPVRPEREAATPRKPSEGGWRELKIDKRESLPPAARSLDARPRPDAPPAESTPKSPVVDNENAAQEQHAPVPAKLPHKLGLAAAPAQEQPRNAWQTDPIAPDATALDFADLGAAMPLIAHPTPLAPVDDATTATLRELFPEYFTHEAASAPVVVADLVTAGDAPPVLGFIAETSIAGTAATAAPIAKADAPQPEISLRDRRYALGFGKPFAGHAPVNRRHIDRFGRPIPLPMERAMQAKAPAPIAAAFELPKTLPTSAEQLPVPAPLARPAQLPLVADDLPTFGQPVAYQAPATRLHAATPGFQQQSASATPLAESASSASIAVQPADPTLAPLPIAPAFATIHTAPGLQSPAITAPAQLSAPIPTQPGVANIAGVDTLIGQGHAEVALPTPPAASPRETVAFRDIATRIAAQWTPETVPEGSSRLRVTLRPPELGTITIELTRTGDQLQTRIVTRTQEAHLLFEKLLPDLRQQLEDRGFTLRQFDLRYQGSGTGQEQGAPQHDWTRPQHGWERPPQPQHLIEIPENDAGVADLHDLLPDILHSLNLTV